MPNWLEQFRRRRLDRFAARHRALADAPSAGSRYRYVRWKWRALCIVVDAVGFDLRRICELLSDRREGASQPDPRRILVVQQDHLGDAILSTGLLRGLRHRYPSATIDVLASDANHELFAACPEVDEVLTASVNRFARGRRFGWTWSLLKWGLKLRRRRYDLAIDPRGDFSAAVLLWLSGARRRLGWGCGGGGFLLTDVAEYSPHRPEVLSRQALLDRLGIAPPPGEIAWPPRVEQNQDAARWAAEQFHDDDSRPLVVCHIGAGTSAKRWPPAHWREVVKSLSGGSLCPSNVAAFARMRGTRIAARVLANAATASGVATAQSDSTARIVLVGGNADRAAAVQIASELPDAAIDDRTGRLSLMQLAAVIGRANLFIGADSGPAHLAAAVGTPAVVLFSGTNDSDQWRPWGEGVTVVQEPVSCAPCHREHCPLAGHPCILGLQPTAVVACVQRALESSRGLAFKERVLA